MSASKELGELEKANLKNEVEPAFGISYCGLMCFACKRYAERECPSCKSGPFETCVIAECAKDRELASCLECNILCRECDTWKRGMLEHAATCGRNTQT